eukprot:6064049-Amphidinium_carterae.1
MSRPQRNLCTTTISVTIISAGTSSRRVEAHAGWSLGMWRIPYAIARGLAHGVLPLKALLSGPLQPGLSLHFTPLSYAQRG